MTRYNDDTWAKGLEENGYREGVDRVLKWLKQEGYFGEAVALQDAIEEGII